MLEKLSRLLKVHGIVFPVESLVNTTALTCYRLGPLGTLIRRNITQQWWNSVVLQERYIYPVTDGQVVDKCSPNKIASMLKTLNQQKRALTNSSTSHIRTSLSEGTLDHYLMALQLSQHQVPLGLAQYGTCMKVHDSPAANIHSNQLYNLNEYQDMVVQLFTPPALTSRTFDSWQRRRLQWWRQFARNPAQFSAQNIAHNDADKDVASPMQEVHFLYKFPWGKDVVEVLTNKGSLPLEERQNRSGTSHQAMYGDSLLMPDMIESKVVAEHGMLAFLLDAYRTRQNLHSRQQSDIIQINRKLAAYKLAVLINISESAHAIRHVANHVLSQLKARGVVMFVNEVTETDTTELFTRFDEMGIPHTLLFNADTLSSGTVQLRDRDTEIIELVSLSHMQEKVIKYTQTDANLEET